MAIRSLNSLYIMKVLLENTNQYYPMTSKKIIDALSKYDVKVDRKTIYEAVENLKQFGIDLKQSKVKPKGYYVAAREFDIPELKLLVDAVQSSKFITEKKSIELINKIKQLTDIHSASALQREVHIAGRVKSANEKIYYNIDTIHLAIAKKKKISFQYSEYSLNKRLVLRKNGKQYIYTPVALIWVDEYYYLVVYDAKHKSFVHFRTDKMKNIIILKEIAVKPDKLLDVGLYAKQVFSMFGGNIELVTLEADNCLVGAFIDKFGKDIIILKKDTTFQTRLNISISSSFFAWLFQFGGKVRIISPECVKDRLKKAIKDFNNIYL